MTVWTDFAADLVGDGDFGQAATYTPPVGAPVSLRIVFDTIEDARADPGDAGLRAPRRVALARTADLASPVRDAVIASGGASYKLTSFRRDAAGALWILSLFQV